MFLNKILSEAKTEEELKNFFAKYFNIPLRTQKYIDLYTPQILFEFKLDAQLNNPQIRAKVVAQTLYYIRRLKSGKDNRPLCNNICVVTKFAAVFLRTSSFERFYKKKTYDWDLAPSSPCKDLVDDLADYPLIKNCHVYDFADAEDENNFINAINRNLDNQILLFDERKQINENNFYDVFKSWLKKFGAAVDNGRKPSEYFITDIEDGKSELLTRGVLFQMSNGEFIKKFLNQAEYKYFWSVYEKIRRAAEIISIRQKMDRMTEITLRRFTGEFFTPIEFAEKAVDYLARTVGDNWYKSGKFRLWDMAAGTGNLEFVLPAAALKYCYISTLLNDDADYCKKIFPDATVFQYDYLNDDVNFFGHEAQLEGLGVARKMPQKLVDDLKNPDLRWIIFINPPYATANNYERDERLSKDGVSMTAIRNLMSANNMGKASRELYSQFLYRISREFKDRQAWLGMFSKVKYINANIDQEMRDKFFKYKFERGFVFNSKAFNGCKAQFPVGFLIWNLANKIPLESQRISLDVYNLEVEKIAEKIFREVNKNDTLNKWIKRPRCTKKFPPMKSALNFGFDAKNRDDLIAENALASMMFKGNDFFNQNGVAILSAPYSSGHDISVTPENFEECMIMHMVRRLPKATWLNDRDQFMQPTKELPREFVTDAVIWSLFAPSNQTVSLRDVEYEGEVYRIPNNFYPFSLAEVRRWECSSPEIRLQLEMAREDRFAASWIRESRADLSSEALAVLTAGRAIYKVFYESLYVLEPACKKWKIEDWDVGWYQIRRALSEFPDEEYTHIQMAIKNLSAKLLPQIYELGFLRDEVKYFS